MKSLYNFKYVDERRQTNFVLPAAHEGKTDVSVKVCIGNSALFFKNSQHGK